MRMRWWGADRILNEVGESRRTADRLRNSGHVWRYTLEPLGPLATKVTERSIPASPVSLGDPVGGWEAQQHATAHVATTWSMGPALPTSAAFRSAAPTAARRGLDRSSAASEDILFSVGVRRP